MRRARAILAAIALVTVAAACSDDDKGSSATTAAATAESSPANTPGDTAEGGTTVTDDTLTDDTILVDDTALDDSSAPGPGAGTEFCEINARLNEQDAFDSTATPEEVQAFFGDVLPTELENLRDTAPDDLKDDLEVLTAGITGFVEILEANDWDLDTTLNDPAVNDLLGSDEYFAAGGNVDAYCGGT